MYYTYLKNVFKNSLFSLETESTKNFDSKKMEESSDFFEEATKDKKGSCKKGAGDSYVAIIYNR
jgi:hypothetical protein